MMTSSFTFAEMRAGPARGETASEGVLSSAARLVRMPREMRVMP